MATQPTAPTPSLSPSYLQAHHDQEVIISSGLFIAAGTVALVLRLFARRFKINSGWGLDDTLIILSFVSLVALCAFCIGAVRNLNVGRHNAAIFASEGPVGLVPVFKAIFVLKFLWIISTALPKLSILVLYLRIFGSIRRDRWACYATIAFIVADFIAVFVANALSCQPISSMWDGTYAEHCFDVTAFYAASQAPNVLSDVLIMLIPLPTLYGLQMPWSKKIGTVIVFLIGSVGLFGSCYNFAMYMRRYSPTPQEDFAWSSADGFVWAVIEPGTCFVAACLITVKPLLNRVLRSRPVVAVLGPLGYSKDNYGNKSKASTGCVCLDNLSKRTSGNRTHGDSGWTRLNGEYYTTAEAQQRASSTDALVEEGRREFGAINVQKNVTITHETRV